MGGMNSMGMNPMMGMNSGMMGGTYVVVCSLANHFQYDDANTDGDDDKWWCNDA